MKFLVIIDTLLIIFNFSSFDQFLFGSFLILVIFIPPISL